MCMKKGSQKLPYKYIDYNDRINNSRDSARS